MNNHCDECQVDIEGLKNTFRTTPGSMMSISTKICCTSKDNPLRRIIYVKLSDVLGNTKKEILELCFNCFDDLYGCIYGYGVKK